MSFLFGKKSKEGKDSKESKGQNALPQRPAEPPGGVGSNASIPTLNGSRSKDRGGGVISPTPGALANKSANPVEDPMVPSPEQKQGLRGRLDSDLQHAPRPAPTGPPPGVRPAELYPWSQRRLTFTSSQPNPFPRYGAAVNAVSSKEGDVYLMGGLVNGSTVKGDLWMIEAGGSNLACYPVGTTFEGPGPRVGHASLLVGNAFIVFGGDTKQDERDKLDDTLYLLNTSTRHWSRSMPPGPRPAGRYGHTLNILGSRIYVFGGQVEGYFFNDLLAFDLNALQNANSKWEMLIHNSKEGGPPEGHVPPARTNHTIVSWNDKLYLFGGTNGTQWFNDVWTYDPKQVAWTQLDCIGYIPAAREGHSAALVGDVMYIFGGRTAEGEDLGDLAAFKITSRRWYTFQNMGPSPSPRSGHSMTAFGKQIVVLAGEPSSAPRDAGELSLVYVLNTDKIRYPNDQQIQQTPSGERVVGNRRPSQERGMTPQGRGFGGPNNTIDDPYVKHIGSRESIAGPPGPGSGRGIGLGQPVGQMGRGQDMSVANGPSPPGPGSRLPRASMAQAPSGPPPQQQAPPPRSNGAVPAANGAMGPVGAMTASRSRTPTGTSRGHGPNIDTTRGASFEKEDVNHPVVSPVAREGTRQASQNRAMSPAVNGRRTPTQPPSQSQLQQTSQQPPRLDNQVNDEEEHSRYDPSIRSKSRQDAQESLDENDQVPTGRIQQQRSTNNHYDKLYNPRALNQATKDQPTVSLQQLEQVQIQLRGMQNQWDELRIKHEGMEDNYKALQHEHRGTEKSIQHLRNEKARLTHELELAEKKAIKELESTKSQNTWYASELALARKEGYKPGSLQGSTLDDTAVQSLGEEDRPLMEALMTMRTQLTEVKGSLEARENSAAQEVAEVEAQRDTAIREAAYAKAKLAAHGASRIGTPQSDNMSRDIGNEDRSNDLGRKLAAALATQQELRVTIATMSSEIQNEKRGRELAEGTADAAQRRAAEFDQSRNPGELESLRTELHHIEKAAREEAAEKSEAESKAQMLELDKEDLERKLEEALENTKQHSITFESLREAVTASADKTALLERKLDEERRQRELIDQKLLQLRSEHEERTAELDETTRRLRDAEDMANTHAEEAKTHRQAVAAGLEKLSTRGVNDQQKTSEDDRIPVLKKQLESAQALVRENQAAADKASEKVRRAEERIAGLEAYQEQCSRESLNVRKQLQEVVREHQELQAKHIALGRTLEAEQQDANALKVQHSTLKDLLSERGTSISERRMSRTSNSPGSRPGSRFGTPDASRIRELEQQLLTTRRALDGTTEHSRIRELEQQLLATQRARDEIKQAYDEKNQAYEEKKQAYEERKQACDEATKAQEELKLSLESRELEADRTYSEKLALLENDYQSAVSYVKGTEKMLKRMKDELTKSKKQNELLVKEIETGAGFRPRDPEAATKWEEERESFLRQIGESRLNLHITQKRLEDCQLSLAYTQQDKDEYDQQRKRLDLQLQTYTQETRTELDQLKKENSMLENRALDAEQKVTLLLDQVGTSVGNYRRQSQQINGHGPSHNRTLSNISTTSTQPPNSRHPTTNTEASDPNALTQTPSNEANNNPNNRNSLALDSLASELETLRSHWADTHRTYRLSNQFDFERSTPTSATGPGGMSDSLANWRKRLDAEEAQKTGEELRDSTDESEVGEHFRESGVLKGHGNMPGALAASSDDDDDDDEEKDGVKRASSNYAI